MARSFNGTSDKIDVTGVTGKPIGAAVMAVSYWIYPTALPAAYAGLTSQSGTYFTSYLKSTGKLAIYNQSGNYDGSGANTLSINNWYNIAFNFPGGAGGASYVNNTFDATFSGTGGAAPGGLIALELANDAGFPTRWFQGYMADVAVWNNINLTAGEIASLSRGIRPYLIRSNNLVGYWPLSGLIPNYEPDMTPYAHNGVLTGTSLAPDPPFLQKPIDPLLRDIIIFLPPTVAPPLFSHNISGHFSRKVTTIGY